MDLVMGDRAPSIRRVIYSTLFKGALPAAICVVS